MRPFRHESLPGRVVFGPGSSAALASELEGELAGRVMLIAGGSAAAEGERIAGQLAWRVAGVFGKVAQHVPEELAAEGSRFAADCDAEVVVTVGGGFAGSEMTPFSGVTGTHKRVSRDLRALPRPARLSSTSSPTPWVAPTAWCTPTSTR